MSQGIYELWGSSTTGSYNELHESVRQTTAHLWSQYKECSFAFVAEAFNYTLSASEQLERINLFRYLGFQGRVDLKAPEQRFSIFEEYEYQPTRNKDPNSPGRSPKRLFFGRFVGNSTRHLVGIHDLKKRPYISTTSMDAELALLTANFALAAPGKLFYDPFMGTGGFLVSAAEFGASVIGSDIDGRSFRGKDKRKAKNPHLQTSALDTGVGKNMIKYGSRHLLLDCFTSDLTNTPLRMDRLNGFDGDKHQNSNIAGGWLDGIVSDPPYGVREGLKVLGLRRPVATEIQDAYDAAKDPLARPALHYLNGVPAHTLPGYVAPKRPYSFLAMLDDILSFAAMSLVENGRLSFWMPVANDADDIQDHLEGSAAGSPDINQEEGKKIGEEKVLLDIPQHRELELVAVCVQPFSNWSRRLLTYRKRRKEEILVLGLENKLGKVSKVLPSELIGKTADELNSFRKKYFDGFKT